MINRNKNKLQAQHVSDLGMAQADPIRNTQRSQGNSLK